MSDTPRTDAKLDIYRQWFDAVQDLSPEYLEPLDYQLAKQLYEELGMRVPKSILLQVDKAMKAGKLTDTPRTDCCCAEHHANYGRCLQCPIHGTPPPDGTQAQVEALQRELATANVQIEALLRAPIPVELKNAWNENKCGDLECESYRIKAAVMVLTGGVTHREHADNVLCFPACACGDSFTADSVCINCVTSERSSFEAQIEALRRETIDKCAEISSEHECLSYHELCNCRGAITDAILAMKETGE